MKTTNAIVADIPSLLSAAVSVWLIVTSNQLPRLKKALYVEKRCMMRSDPEAESFISLQTISLHSVKPRASFIKASRRSEVDP